MGEAFIPWGWQDTAALVGCVGALAFASWLAWRARRASARGGCGDCAAPGPPAAPRVVIPEGQLRLGRRAASGGRAPRG